MNNDVTKIKVIDAICGAGKTSWAIQMINDSEKVNGFGEISDKKYIYVTPFLNEVERVSNSTKADFFQPDATKGKGSKIEHFKMLVELGKSIVTTHELFKRLDAETLEEIEHEGYILIMDEVANVLEAINVSHKDIEYLLKWNVIEVDELGKVTWLDVDYGQDKDDRFRDIKIIAENENLFILQEKAFYWTMNIKAFEAFDEVYILTYLFDGQIQKYYYEMHKVQYTKHSVQKNDERYELTKYNAAIEPRKVLYGLLNIYEDYQTGKSVSKMNSNYDSREKLTSKQKHYQLSSTWFDNAPQEDLKQLKNNANNYLRNICPTDNNKIFWTTKKKYAPILKNPKCKYNKKDDRLKDNFVSFNARATNDYAECESMVYMYNRFMNPNDKQFFTTRSVGVDEDLLAVSDLIQFIFRGCIRKGQPMNCYIPSERMRKLLSNWADYKI
ncbi:DEAD/DEAH box helicase family protein [Bacillus mycoides]